MQNTNRPQKAAQSEASGAERRWGRVRDVEQQFSLKRTTIYSLIKSGRIDSVALCVTGKRCRARLVDLDSVREFVESQIRPEKEAA
jgi:hypothetical protein